MKSRKLTLCAVLGLLLTAVCLPQSVAQAPTNRHYRLIVLGPLGGVNSATGGITDGGAGGGATGGLGTLNNRGDVAVVGEIDVADPFAPEFDLFHAYSFQNGHITLFQTLPVRPGSAGNHTYPNAINDFRLTAGWSENGVLHPLNGFPELRAVLWNGDGQVTNLGAFGGYQSAAILMNNFGQIAGWMESKTPDPFSWAGGGRVQAFFWQNGHSRLLGNLPGGNNGMPFALNLWGQLAGCSDTSSDVNSNGFVSFAPYLWTNGHLINLGNFGGQGGCAASINNHGQVAGYSNLPGDQHQRAFLWDKGKLTDLGTLGGPDAGAFVINDRGDIVGAAGALDATGKEIFRAALWRDGAITDLTTVEGDRCSQALDINHRGQVVGSSGDCNLFTNQHAFLWESGNILDLNSVTSHRSSIELQFAFTINDCGEIAGNGTLATGENRAFVLIPQNCPGGTGEDIVPEVFGFAPGTFGTVPPARLQTNPNAPTTPLRNRKMGIFDKLAR